nr:hypothetical protein [uncultured Actinoplanes sp.]
MTQPPPPYPSHPAQPGGAQPYPSYGPTHPSAPFPAAVPPPPPAGRWQPERVEPLPGTEFSLVQLRVQPIVSGLAIGSLVAGIGSILVSLLVFCFGLTGSSRGWGGWVAGAFTVLSVVVGAGAIAVGLGARRQIRRSGHTGQVRFTGGGVAIAGISCGAAGAGIALGGLVLTLVLQLTV